MYMYYEKQILYSLLSNKVYKVHVSRMRPRTSHRKFPVPEEFLMKYKIWEMRGSLTARKQNQPTPNGTQGVGWAQALTVQACFFADKHGGLREEEGPQWKLKEATCVQLHAGLTSRCMRQQALWGHGKWKLGDDKWKAFFGLGAHRHGIR